MHDWLVVTDQVLVAQAPAPMLFAHAEQGDSAVAHADRRLHRQR